MNEHQDSARDFASTLSISHDLSLILTDERVEGGQRTMMECACGVRGIHLKNRARASPLSPSSRPLQKKGRTKSYERGQREMEKRVLKCVPWGCFETTRA